MKKILLSIILLFTINISISSVFGDECAQKCNIEQWSAEVLNTYISDNQTLINNISSELAKIPSDQQSFFTREGLRIYNWIVNWTEFNTGIEFLQLNLKSEIPYPIKRDLRLLEKESDYLNSILKTTITSWKAWIKIENICDWLPNCDLSWTAWNVLGTIIKNNTHIIQFYKLSILWREWEFHNPLIIVENNFKDSLHNSYNKYSIQNCSSCKEGFSKISLEAIKKISLKDKKWKKWIQDWKNAWDILVGNTDNTQVNRDREKRLLSEELSRQWVSQSNGEAVLGNLNKYNNNQYTSKNNPLNNSFETFKNTVDTSKSKQLLNDFSQTVGQIYEKFLDNIDSWSANKEAVTIPISKIPQVWGNILQSQEIMNTIDALYNREIPFIAKADLNNEKLKIKIESMHRNLMQAIQILENTRPISEKVCNDQARWVWKCKY